MPSSGMKLELGIICLACLGLFQNGAAQYTQFTDCGGNLTQQAGTIESPNFPKAYPMNARCSWIITASNNQVIDLKFNHLDLDRTYDTSCNDYLYIYDGPNTLFPIIGSRLCGYQNESKVLSLRMRSTGHQLRIDFYSDNLGSRQGFSISFWSHECLPFTHGHDLCNTPCSCVEKNSLYCVSMNGTCICKNGWTSRNCSEDVNECLDPNLCPDLYSTCDNSPGSYDCNCKHGLSKNSTGGCEDSHACTGKSCSHTCGVISTNPRLEQCYCPKGMKLNPADNLTCIECNDWTYGDNCAYNCNCNIRNTRSCDKRNGLCTCYLNWTSTDCSQDFNECGLQKLPCSYSTTHSDCYNSVGSFYCRCYTGYEKINETTCTECGRLLTQPSGTIESETYTYYYSRLIDEVCNWTISVEKTHVISLIFTQFRLYDYGSYYTPDSIAIYDGSNSSAKLIQQFYAGSSVTLPKSIVRSLGNTMHISRLRGNFSSTWSSFKVSYWSHECQEFMYDANCTTPCTCVKANTNYCSSTTGQCICKEGWTSENCSVDIDECYENPLACPDYSTCKNLNGNYSCTCKEGLVKNSAGQCDVAHGAGICQRGCSHICVKITPKGSSSQVEECYCPIGMELNGNQCVDCKNMTYGPDCYRPCSCIEKNTASCDARTGNCTCLSSWTENNCSKDVDECKLGSFSCKLYSNCSNTAGSYNCTCSHTDGYKEASNGTCIPIECNQTFKNASGMIQSPDYPSSYFNNARCNYSITVSPGDVVSLRFRSFYIYSSYKCDDDYVDIFDGSNSSARLIGRYCKSGYPSIIRTTGNQMFISFVSDWYYNSGSFFGSFTSHICPPFTYGDTACDKNCTCIKENTDFCNSVNGQCVCKPGWTLSDCSFDVNECLATNVKACPVNSDCINTLGSFRCECHPGFVFNKTSGLCDLNTECVKKSCSHACYIVSPNVEQCACPEGLILEQKEGLTCVVPYYPYGRDANDMSLESSQSQPIRVSGPVRFSSAVPFGKTLQTSAFVQSNGIVTFGGSTISLNGASDLILVYNRNFNVIAPFWTNTKPSSGNVYYHLYEKCGPQIFSESSNMVNSSKMANVIRRAEKDITEFYKLPGFEANSVLVMTWDRVQPYAKVSQPSEVNTFQGIYIAGWKKETHQGFETLSGEMTSYVIFIYQLGKMNWSYLPGRPVSIGVTGHDVLGLKDADTIMVTLLDKLAGNSGYKGVITYAIGSSNGPEQRCHQYVCKNAHLLTDPIYENELRQLYKCPCTLERLGMQWQLYERRGVNNDIYCYAISRVAKQRLLQDNRRNKLCCYQWKKPDNDDWQVWLESWRQASYLPASPDSGHVLIYDPWPLYSSNYKSVENIWAHQWCCRYAEMAKACERFYKIFPDMGCTNFVEFIPASALGDPHITTLDGATYTMNGLGEYIMLDIPSQKFTLQARTGKAETSNGTLTNATVFVAFAAKELDSASFQVELASTNTTMVILANGKDLTNDFYNTTEFSFFTDTIGILKQYRGNRIILAVSFPCGVAFRVHVGIKSLEIAFEVDKSLGNQTRGLLGNFNRRIDDDFTLPNGTVLSAKMTERQIYEQFAKKWTITSLNSVFSYNEGKSTRDYQHAEFVPFFKDEASVNLIAEAQKLCGLESDACIFDYIVTQNELLARNTKDFREEQEIIIINLENNPPTLTVRNGTSNNSSYLVVMQGVETTIQVVAEDSDRDKVFYELIGDLPGARVNQQGLITFIPDINQPGDLGVRANDSKGSYSEIVYIKVAVCSGCSGHGQCDENVTREVAYKGGHFKILVCNCYPAYTGDDCEKEVDACAYNPCSKGQECTDLTAAQQGNSTVGYKCGPCPTGYENFEGQCADINECNSSSACHQVCINTEGSFLCDCHAGFRMDADRKTCKDMNECELRTSKCQQMCQNTEGNYTCACQEGYTLTSDGINCTLSSSYLAVCKDCEQVCTVTPDKKANCSCNLGYQIDPTDKTKCIDVNECSAKNKPCSQLCVNNKGDFECLCYTGYQLNNDGVSCSSCERPYYGRNCSEICQCNGRGTCDHVKGCVCEASWTGVGCDQDVDECAQPDACPLGLACENMIGSYRCVCPDGFQMEYGSCADINECSSPLSNMTCNLTVEVCVNTEGGYNCECQKGYARDLNRLCQDVDECQNNVNGCEQICENVPGQYNCKCYTGYQLAQDRHKCVKERDPCEGTQSLNCSYSCRIVERNRPECYCPLHYELQSTGECQDINECQDDNANLCSNKSGCINVNGSYQCSCQSGQKLDNDKRTCIACSNGTWGIKCTNQCACGEGADYCDPQIGCVCKKGFTGKHCTVDINECESGQQTCGAYENCLNLPGTAFCVCQKGYAKNSSDLCEDIDECRNTSTHNCSQICNNSQGGFSCSCYPGYIYNSTTHTCWDVDECKLKTGQCEQMCINTEGSYRCSCSSELQLQPDGLTCQATTPCVKKQNCDYQCAVLNGTETCLCPKGKQLSSDGLKCLDIDLCDNSPCTAGCVEIEGNTTYRCICTTGMMLTADRITCINCTDGSWGLNCREICPCVAANTQYCDTVTGSCTCKIGWEGNNCSSDIDECLASISLCPTHSVCKNLPGSYMCTCIDGYFKRNASNGQCEECDENYYGPSCATRCTCGDHFDCNNINGACSCSQGWRGIGCGIDINECVNNSHTCDSLKHETCVNDQGGYHCICEMGYHKLCDTCDCLDVNECLNPSSCEQICTNTNGSFTCSCRTGFRVSPISGSKCEDINECLNSPCEQNCTNTNGTFTCSCINGYKVSTANPSKCQDINECLSSPCEQNCTNTNGSFACSCRAGFRVINSSKCEDVNECLNSPCEQNCTNTNGSFTCSCINGYKVSTANSSKCQDINECQNSPCEQNCTNTNGSFVCSCRAGYKVSALNSSRCEEVNKCQTTGPPPCEQMCTNSNGSFVCSCTSGYQVSSTDSSKCEDINECLNSSCQHNCINTNGSFTCSCRAGFKVSVINSSKCEDINECLNSPCEQDCTNTNGSFTCSCISGHKVSTADSSKCEAIFIQRVTAIYVLDASGLDLTNTSSDDYMKLKKEAEQEIMTKLKGRGVPVLQVIVTAFRKGSLIAEYDIVTDNVTGSNPEVLLLLAFLDIMDKDKFSFSSSKSPVALQLVQVNGTAYSANDTTCERKQKMDPCTGTDHCEEVNGEAVCRVKEEKGSRTDLILGLALGISLFLILCAFIGGVTYYWVYRKHQKSPNNSDHSVFVSKSRRNLENERTKEGSAVTNNYYFDTKYLGVEKPSSLWRNRPSPSHPQSAYNS